ncbi:hypothetical protein XENTR_v10024916 [Xenopus tropicalis]|nr:hypothetical protein XENTR_v10024916 [Xenopus tropicalis]
MELGMDSLMVGLGQFGSGHVISQFLSAIFLSMSPFICGSPSMNSSTYGLTGTSRGSGNVTQGPFSPYRVIPRDS